MRPNSLRTRQQLSRTSDVFAGIESLEARCLLTSAFNPDGPTIATPSEAPTSIITADFDGDSKPDLVMSVGQDIIFQKGGGGGRFGAPRVIAHLNSKAGLLGVGDFNGDGLKDIFSIEKETYRGWHRMLLNNGNASFSIASYGRTTTRVQTVTVGDIDGDIYDEVLLEGVSPLLVLNARDLIGEPPDEIRILDPLVPFVFGGTIPSFGPTFPLPFLRFNDLGIALRGPKFTAPVISNLTGGPFTNIIIGGENPSAPGAGWVQVYDYTHPFLFPIIPLGDAQTAGLPPPLLNPVGDALSFAGVVSSVAATDMTGDSKLDLVVSTLVAPIVPTPFTAETGAYQAKTVLLPRTGLATEYTFGDAATVDTRTLAAPALDERRALVPEYRIATVADINSDGLPDVGLSVVQEFYGGVNGPRRVARFVQAIHSDVIGIFGTLIVAQLTARGGANDLAFDRPHIFLAADVRRVGRPDLIIAMPNNSSGFTPVSIRYNVPGFPIIAF